MHAKLVSSGMKGINLNQLNGPCTDGESPISRCMFGKYPWFGFCLGGMSPGGG